MRRLRKNKIDDRAMESAERHYAKSAALMAGAGKLLTDYIANSSWGNRITIDVSLQLLEEARGELQAGDFQHRKAKDPANRNRMPRKRRAGGKA